MKGLSDIRYGLIRWLKSNTVLAALHQNFPTEIREKDWMGTDYDYPCIRLGDEVVRFTDVSCTRRTAEGRIFVFSVLPSSLECNQIADAVNVALHGKSFSVSGTNYAGIMVTQNAAQWIEEGKTWRSDLGWTATISG